MFCRSTFAFSVLIVALLGCWATAIPVHAAADAACKPVFDANARQKLMPTHVYLTMPEAGEQIYAGGVIYVLRKGIWKRSPMTPQQMLDQEQENIRTATSYSCRNLRDEMINGEAATLYATQGTNEGIKSAGQIWISKSRGVPLKLEEEIDTGGGDKRHVSARYDYANVQAPSGVK